MPDLEDAPFVYTTYERALNYIPFERKKLSYVIAGPIQGMDAGEVTSLIHLDTGLSAYTAQDFRKLTMNYIIHNTGIPIGFGVSLVLAFVVGMAIAVKHFCNLHCKMSDAWLLLKQWGSLRRSSSNCCLCKASS